MMCAMSKREKKTEPGPAKDVVGMQAAGEVAAVWKPIEWVKRWDRNPRINARAVESVAASIRRFGFGAPLICRSDGTLIAGDTRIQAATKLELRTVPVRIMDHLSDDEASALAIADNRTAETAEWSDGLGALLLEMGPDLASLTGHTDTQLRRLTNTLDFTPDPLKIPKDRYQEQFAVVVTCKDAKEQAEVYERLRQEGLSVRVLVT